MTESRPSPSIWPCLPTPFFCLLQLPVSSFFFEHSPYDEDAFVWRGVLLSSLPPGGWPPRGVPLIEILSRASFIERSESGSVCYFPYGNIVLHVDTLSVFSIKEGQPPFALRLVFPEPPCFRGPLAYSLRTLSGILGNTSPSPERRYRFEVLGRLFPRSSRMFSPPSRFSLDPIIRVLFPSWLPPELRAETGLVE